MIIVSIFTVSLILGIIKYGSLDGTKSWSWQQKFAEIWNCTVNFLLSGLIGYYFILVRWSLLLKGAGLGSNDFILFIIFTLGIFGHLNIMSLNITQGISAILKRVLEGK